MNKKPTVSIWLVFMMIPPFVFLFVFGAVFGGIIIEDKLGAGAAFAFVPLYWGAMMGGVAKFLTTYDMD